MAAMLSFFPVDNGDMTLVAPESGRTLLIDLNIRAAADDPDDDTPDVASELRDRLHRDAKDRLYVDALLISHPDKDHCTGLQKHFHLGPPGGWSTTADKIFVREIWSSPMVFRRASRRYTLCDDAKAFNTEARRRVRRFREVGDSVADGDRILILGEDENGKTDDLDAILIPVDNEFSRVNGQTDHSLNARLLAPLPKSHDDDEDSLSKNNSSTILRLSLTGDQHPDKCRFLTGGDAEVAIWDRLWRRHSSRPLWLSYDILQAPHHCSWHSLSYDSWSEKGEDAKVSQDARNALSRTRDGATIVASSVSVVDDDRDPPCIRAKREYLSILRPVKGDFCCVGDRSDVMDFEIGAHGHRLKSKSLAAASVFGPAIIGRQPLPHG